MYFLYAIAFALLCSTSNARRRQRCPWRRDSGIFFEITIVARCARGRYVLKKNAKIPESKHRLDILKCNTSGFDESDRLVTTVVIQNSHSRKNQNIFLRTIAAA